MSIIQPTLVILLIVAVIGWVATGIRYRSLRLKLDGNSRERQTLEQSLQVQNVEHNRALADLTNEKEEVQRLELTLKQTQSEKHNIEKELIKFQERIEGLEKLKKEFSAQMKNEFANISNDLLRKNTRNFTELSREKIGEMLLPLSQNINSFQKRINEVHDVNVKNFGSIEKSIESVQNIGKVMSGEAEQLTKALKGNKQILGAWGETQLETSLQNAGLVENEHYVKQQSHRDESGKTRRLDFVIKLPENKHIVIDAKTTLNSFIEINEAESEEERHTALKQFFQAIQNHFEDLSGKYYHRLEELDSPMYVLMYIPLESAYLTIMSENKHLFEAAYRKNIIIVSHATLLPVLSTVSNLWRLSNSSRDARQISHHAGKIYEQCLTFATRMQLMGKKINDAALTYNDTVRALTGRQGLIGKAKKFKELSDKSQQEIEDIKPVREQCNLPHIEGGGATAEDPPLAENLLQED